MVCEEIKALGYEDIGWEREPRGKDRGKSRRLWKEKPKQNQSNLSLILILFTHFIVFTHMQAIYCFHTHKHTPQIYHICITHIEYVHTQLYSHTLNYVHTVFTTKLNIISQRKKN